MKKLGNKKLNLKNPFKGWWRAAMDTKPAGLFTSELFTSFISALSYGDWRLRKEESDKGHIQLEYRNGVTSMPRGQAAKASARILTAMLNKTDREGQKK